MKGKEDLYKKYASTQVYNNNTATKEKTNSLSQRNRRIINLGGNNSINSNTMRVKNVIINKNINNYILKPYNNNLSSNRSHSKIIKKRKIYENNFNNSLQIEKKQNLIMKTIENRKKINSSLDKNNIYNSSNSRQRHTQYIKCENQPLLSSTTYLVISRKKKL